MGRPELALIALGGFASVTFRYAVSVAIPGADGTFTVNVPESFAFGTFITSVFSYRAQPFFGTGLLLSSMMYSTLATQAASPSSVGGMLNVGVNYALGLVAAALGLMFGGRR